MHITPLKKIIAIVLLLLIISLGTYWVISSRNKKIIETPVETIEVEKSPIYKVIGKSVQGRNIESYTYGTGTKQLVFVGGMHGGYEWNSVLLAYEFIDYLNASSTELPSDLSITIIPALNVDGVYAVTKKEGRFNESDVSHDKKTLVSGRFNAHGIDINRNFDCNWKPKSTWQNKVVSAGTSTFSEPEASALRDFVKNNKPSAFIFWHSQANTVYGSQCNKGILPTTVDIMNAYAKSAGYNAVKSFDAYPVSGDSEGWLASIGIPAITVEMKTHDSIEWDKNLLGFNAVLNYFTKK